MSFANHHSECDDYNEFIAAINQLTNRLQRSVNTSHVAEPPMPVFVVRRGKVGAKMHAAGFFASQGGRDHDP